MDFNPTPTTHYRTRVGNQGSARRIFIWIIVAASILLTLAIRMYRDGASDIGFIVAMAVAGVIAIAIVAPKRFTSVRGADPKWEDEDPYGADSESNDDKTGSDHSASRGSRNNAA